MPIQNIQTIEMLQSIRGPIAAAHHEASESTGETSKFFGALNQGKSQIDELIEFHADPRPATGDEPAAEKPPTTGQVAAPEASAPTATAPASTAKPTL